MKELIKSVKDFKIIPSNFKSAGTFEVKDLNDNEITVELSSIDEKDLNDYIPNSSVEVFGVNEKGLVYFETKIISIKSDIAKLAIPKDYSIIQRREYSRVNVKQGDIKFKDEADDIVKEISDISAGGVKIKTKVPLVIDRIYDIDLLLSTNMVITCKLQPIRIKKIDNDTYDVSAKFINLENMDRIILIQYTFKIKLEEENKENNK